MKLCIFLIIILLINTTSGICQFSVSDGIIDLRTLSSRDGQPLFRNIKSQDPFDDYLYSYEPCSIFNEFDCLNSYVCQSNISSAIPIGNIEPTIFSVKDISYIAYRVMNESQLLTQVKLICTQNNTTSVLTAINMKDGVYNFELRSRCCCPNECAGWAPSPTPIKKPDKHSRLIAIICSLVIIFLLILSCTGVYIYKRFVLHKSSLHSIPLYSQFAKFKTKSQPTYDQL
ncbi:unnamed protein product [Didymodactylos carnosus]|uniref:Uncharacterized protein n=1 Tax=Didymodactylos carnosus TaxID=1234261 RepID=A0A813SYF0_9BILA|nr:unnamed protein product [Didymodactylos carnosus]CAF0936536.1 unnamed protein product [Didymodactylos carnosus]CAF3587739.1 unnamed protein product [Didymodactylos carnosus]CAF3712139.1 unnamed protein product [Didymodactylos carnosus]